MATTHTTTSAIALPARLVAGVAGGLAGGVAFGIMMQAWGMLPMVAMLVGSESVAVGWLVHLANAALFGAAFAVLFGRWAITLPAALGIGLGYGLAWWVLGALLIMPAWLGMNDMILQLTTGAWRSLAGHLVFGLLLGLGYALAATRAGRAGAHR
ncbi:hypothetical protein [Salinispora arenicola]|uniref:DUF1440 domain-containing protein n=1 Tax=Salinispora arenicola (strain CNS-205) TaxID=391037 RepID=A8M7Q4_SALAI|nr:hypothetical protein [Salinispora arenicola]MCN0180797.1 hypothetical protein [Salinispora arenicola]NIL57935.1 hypothetical protein [Salinispora arenicola]NIL63589.1 hypothetical protein [Salinispora arenicola]